MGQNPDDHENSTDSGETVDHDVESTVVSSQDDPEIIIARLQDELAEAAPRLEAFGKLERLARERRSTPEAIAVQVTIDVLEEDKIDLENEVGHLNTQRAQAEHDIAELAERRAEAEREIADREQDLADLMEDVAVLLAELESIRSDGVRLLGEKAALETQVKQLRSEVSSLEADVDARGGADVEPAPQRRADDEPSEFESIDDSDEANAFDKFFDADTGKDKARAWMLE